ncbi:MAG: cyclic pyranopterin monophosphate synthase MoaC [Desulfosarcina sp.]|nr:cyclic pyranopterin monophosphate synthase MoaC [Desulfobacterales bacterium]
MTEFTHLDQDGRVRMVDVSDKPPTDRRAIAQAVVVMQPETLAQIQDQNVKKGNVLETARIAGVMAAKQTAALIPMCHPLNLRHVQVDFHPDESRHQIRIEAAVRIHDRTGIEMEALTAATVAALTIYDMCKALDRGMQITDVWLVQKSGGRSGTYRRETTSPGDHGSTT